MRVLRMCRSSTRRMHSYALRSAQCDRATRRVVRRARHGYRVWRRHSPENYEGPWLLMEAEVARAASDFRRAEELYDQTIIAAIGPDSSSPARWLGSTAVTSSPTKVVTVFQSRPSTPRWRDGRRSVPTERSRNCVATIPRSPTGRESARRPDHAVALELTNTMVSELGLDDLLESLLGTIVSVTDAQRGVSSHDGATLVPESCSSTATSSSRRWHRRGLRRISRALRGALGSALLIGDTATSVHGRDQHLHATAVRSVLCMPPSLAASRRACLSRERRIQPVHRGAPGDDAVGRR